MWQGLKDALRAGDLARAESFIHSDTRETYRDQFAQMNPGTLATIDQVMTTIRLVEVGFGGAKCEMLGPGGQVVDVETGQPIAGAVVIAVWWEVVATAQFSGEGGGFAVDITGVHFLGVVLTSEVPPGSG